MPLILPTVTALSFVLAAAAALRLPWPVGAGWAVALSTAAAVFARPLAVDIAPGHSEAINAAAEVFRLALVPAAVFLIWSALEIDRRAGHRAGLAIAAAVGLALVAWPLSTVNLWAAAALCYPPLWWVCAEVVYLTRRSQHE